MDPSTFERKRLQLFKDNGFAGTGRRLRDREGRTTYLIEGGGDGARPTILIHGGLSQAGEWCLLAGRMSGRVVIPDRPGCGLSYPINYRHIDYRQAAADWVLGLVEALGADQVDLVGNSMGGYFATAFATAHPTLVRRMVLAGAPAGLDREIPLFLRLWGNAVAGPVVGRMVKNMKSAEVLRHRVFPMLVAHPEKVPVALLEIALAAQRLPGADAAAHSMLRSVLTSGGWRRDMLMRDDLAGVAVPTLFVWGENDAFAPPSSGEDMAARMPDAAIEIVPDAGHKPDLDQPARVAAAMNAFLEIGGDDAARRTGAEMSKR